MCQKKGGKKTKKIQSVLWKTVTKGHGHSSISQREAELISGTEKYIKIVLVRMFSPVLEAN